MSSRKDCSCPTERIKDRISWSDAALEQVLIKRDRLLGAVTLIGVSPGFNNVTVNSSNPLPAFKCIEHHFPLSLRAIFWQRDPGAVELVVDDRCSMDVPTSHLHEDLEGVEFVLVAADIGMGLWLR